MSEEEIKTMALKMQSALLESSYQMYRKLEQENKLLKEENKKLKTILSKVRKDEDLTIDEKITMEELER